MNTTTTAEVGLFDVLETLLKKANRPLTCVDLYAFPDVQSKAPSVTRVSDYLGGLWRKGKVSRSPAPKSDSDNSKWAYSWRPERGTVPDFKHRPPMPVRSLIEKPNVVVTEDGGTIFISTPHYSLTLKAPVPS